MPSQSTARRKERPEQLDGSRLELAEAMIAKPTPTGTIVPPRERPSAADSDARCACARAGVQARMTTRPTAIRDTTPSGESREERAAAVSSGSQATRAYPCVPVYRPAR